MSIVGFHKVLIVTAILFCAFFGVWEGLAYAREGGIGDLVLAVVFGIAATALGVYLARLDRFLGRETPS